jgi:hypothetical protein
VVSHGEGATLIEKIVMSDAVGLITRVLERDGLASRLTEDERARLLGSLAWLRVEDPYGFVDGYRFQGASAAEFLRGEYLKEPGEDPALQRRLLRAAFNPRESFVPGFHTYVWPDPFDRLFAVDLAERVRLIERYEAYVEDVSLWISGGGDVAFEELDRDEFVERYGRVTALLASYGAVRREVKDAREGARALFGALGVGGGVESESEAGDGAG